MGYPGSIPGSGVIKFKNKPLICFFMKCPHCGKELVIQAASKVNCEGCRVLTAMTSVLTVQCDKCKHVFQIPVQSKEIFGVKKE